MAEEKPTPVEAEVEYIAPPPDGANGAKAANAVVPVTGGAVVPTENAQGTALVAASLGTLKLQCEMARAFPRDMKVVKINVHRSCGNYEFADKATYRFPRGNTTVVGASVYLAEELARQYGHMTWGHTVIDDTPESRTLRCYAWDLQANIRKETDVFFLKLVQRKEGKGPNAKTIWVTPDERDLLMLTNLQAQKGVRNMILALLPDDFKRDAISWAAQTVKKGLVDNPDKARQAILIGFARRGIEPADIEALLGKKVEQATPDDLEYLRSCGVRLKDGDATWDDIRRERAEATGGTPPPPSGASALKAAVADGAAKAKKGAAHDQK